MPARAASCNSVRRRCERVDEVAAMGFTAVASGWVGWLAYHGIVDFRDDAKQDVLLMIDNIFRFIQAGMEVSGLLGQLPSRLGYQPTLATELAELE